MPELFKHFETLDITTDLFLIDWMLTLYSKILDIGVVSRIWDNFMLDGEIFAIKTGLALL
jgi:Rab-GTPase-TBC domain